MDGNMLAQRESYAAKSTLYYGNARVDYVDRLPADVGSAILELGCGDGATGALALASGKCGRYVGIEMFEPMAQQARTKLSEVLVGNIETMTLPYAEAEFDALIMSEVLEHLVDPDAVLKRLLRLIRPGGLVLASSPNIGHWQSLRALLNGRFDYEEEGLMDRTHLRWFTPSSYRRMFETAGVVVDHLGPLNRLSRRERLFQKLLGRRFDALWYYQIDVHGHRA